MVDSRYGTLNFKIPEESEDYPECSAFVIESIETIVENALISGNNKIVINTNLRHGIPMENVNKIAGPFVEAWACEIFLDTVEDLNNTYRLINVEAKERLNMADVILQFQRERKHLTSVTGHVDVKATSDDIEGSGKAPNITSFRRIRSMYIEDPDYLFIILSLKHRVISTKDPGTKMMMGVMEVVGHHTYDLKYLSEPDISYNPALGTGQIQVRDIHYVSQTPRTVWEFCQLLDSKCMSSRQGYEGWYVYAAKFGWIKQ